MKKPLTVEEHQASRYVCEPLHLFDYCLTVGGACVVIVTTAERAKDGPKKPVYLMGMQGMCAGREEATGARPGLGIHQQDESYPVPHPRDLAVFRMAGVSHKDIDAFYTYDAMSSIVWMSLERFGFCKPGEAWQFVKDGHIGAGRRTAGEHQRRASLGGARLRLEPHLRDGAPAAPRMRRAPGPRCRDRPMGDEPRRFPDLEKVTPVQHDSIVRRRQPPSRSRSSRTSTGRSGKVRAATNSACSAAMHAASCGRRTDPSVRTASPRTTAGTRLDGRGKIASWVVFHKVYHPGFAKDVPYNVAFIETD